MPGSNSQKFHNLCLDVFFLVRRLSELHLYDAQEIVEDLVMKNGLWDELVFYATSQQCNGSGTKFKLINKE